MSNNTFDVNITVNGNKCKLYTHQGKSYIQANPGSEYVIEVKNNYCKRVLAVGSVDGLNILTGKSASEKDSGYIIGSYSAEKIKGFRFSDSEWALFKFGYKFNGNTYAQSKEDGSEKNCGVIGLKFFYENEPMVTYTTTFSATPIWYSTTNTSFAVSASYSNMSITGATYQNSVNYCCDGNIGKNAFYTNTDGNATKGDVLRSAIADAKATKATALASSNKSSNLYSGKMSNASSNNRSRTLGICSMPREELKAEFDVGTEWGRRERSKVKNVSFDRGCFAQSFDIYYASREALIAMGVPITNELAVNFPQSFPNSYAQPPKNWVG